MNCGALLSAAVASPVMRLPRHLITIAALGAFYAGAAIAQDSTVDKSKATDSSKPETARDAPATGPETARDEHKSGPETAATDRTNAPETARDPPVSGPETARDDPQSAPETAASDRANTPETATDAPTSHDSHRSAEATGPSNSPKNR